MVARSFSASVARTGLTALVLVLLIGACRTASSPPPEAASEVDYATVGTELSVAGWVLSVEGIKVEESLEGNEGEVFEARADEVFLVVDTVFRNPTPGDEREVSSAEASLVVDGISYVPEGAGEEGVCLGCEFSASTSDETITLRFLFVLDEEPEGTVAFRYQGSEPILLALSGEIDPEVAQLEGAPFVAAPESGWERVEPAGRTICARGDPYAYWVHEGSPDHLLIYFGQGGGCFSYSSCAVDTSLFGDVVDEGANPAVIDDGILNFSDPANPFREYTMVSIPSCTGDVHWGDGHAVYRKGEQKVAIEHRGFVNASAALRWAYENVAKPKDVFITGCSAGSVGSAAHAPFIIERYPQARINQLGDSLAMTYHRPINIQEGYRAHDNFPDWIPELRRIRPGEFEMSDYYRIVAAHYPDVTFGQFNFAQDFAQQMFYEEVGGDPEDFTDDLRRDLRSITRSSPNFRSYTSEQAGHCILGNRDFFTHETDGVSLKDWVSDLVEEVEIRNVGR
jgi:Pectinacetylesterase